MRPDLNRSIRSFFDPRNGGDDVARRLRELPSEADTPYDWDEFRRRERTRYWRPRQAVKWQHAATAAGVTVFIAVMAMWGRSPQHLENVSAGTMNPAPPMQQRPVNEHPQSAAEAVATRQWLAHQPDEPAVMRVGPRLAVANLEDRIAWLDDTLMDEEIDSVDATQVAAIRQERARLVNSLAQVRYAETLAAVN